MSREFLPVPEGCRVQIAHIHEALPLFLWAWEQEQSGLRPLYLRKPKYVTIARLMRGDEVLAEAFAVCSPRDNASRKLGRLIAHNRVIKAYQQREGLAEAA